MAVSANITVNIPASASKATVPAATWQHAMPVGCYHHYNPHSSVLALLVFLQALRWLWWRVLFLSCRPTCTGSVCQCMRWKSRWRSATPRFSSLCRYGKARRLLSGYSVAMLFGLLPSYLQQFMVPHSTIRSTEMCQGQSLLCLCAVTQALERQQSDCRHFVPYGLFR
jgi:hypothetical protein